MRITFEKYFWNFIFISDLFRQKGGDGREEKRVCDCGFCWSCSDGGDGDWSRGDEKTVRQISTASGTTSSSSPSSWSSSSSVHTLLPTQTQPAQTRIYLIKSIFQPLHISLVKIFAIPVIVWAITHTFISKFSFLTFFFFSADSLSLFKRQRLATLRWVAGWYTLVHS